MSAQVAGVWLDHCLSPLSKFLDRDDITDIWINQPKEVWIEALGGSVTRHDVPSLTSALLGRLASQVAAVSAQGINREHPILSASLPTGERIQIIAPPATRGDMAIAIRKHRVSNFTLKDYSAAGLFRDTLVEDNVPVVRESALIDLCHDPAELLRVAVRQRRNILISGGTSTGKTTFANTLLQEVPHDERLILIEDTPELRVQQPNVVGLLAGRSLLGEATVTAEDLLIASLRMRPDRIILGEIRGAEAGTFLRAINTGHPGSISTIHADSPEGAIDQLALLVLQTGIRMSWEDVGSYVRNAVDIIVQLGRKQGKRVIDRLLMCSISDRK